MIVCFEGLDASGKETQSKRLAKFLDARRIAFPTYDTEARGVTGPLIGQHLKGEWAAMRMGRPPFAALHDRDTQLDAHVFQCLQSINKYEMAPTIRNTEAHVVLDRYWPSAYAFGLADGLDPAWLIRIHSLLPQPDVAFLLDVDFETSMARRPDRRDRYEKMGKDFYSKVRANYLALWRDCTRGDWPVLLSSTHKTRWIVIDGTKSPDEVFTSILKELDL